ncbi:hypothetical protein OIU83_13905 [Flavobacterium sp. LS1R49]|uniref:Uncharacterized protein n=1 Tax=Flavobacterium shii TaxID=2987687 RepID=A0A9X2ZDT1_9FLAO|nr:hypothetical protein [Flavobacterium shii]MCV9928760.1 hypothetical protein [Flavobacterium shii]
MINNYKTRIYYYNSKGYDMLVNYSKEEMPFWNVIEEWYNGQNYELSK